MRHLFRKGQLPLREWSHVYFALEQNNRDSKIFAGVLEVEMQGGF